MSTKNIRTFLVLIPLLVLPQSSHAFYNPSTGRWLNRDPIGEKGGRNLYRAMANRPVLVVDPTGREVLPPTTNPGDDLGKIVYWACKCQDMIFKAMWGAHKYANETYGEPGQMHQNAGSIADMMTHCIGACEVAKGEAACKNAGIDARKYLQDQEPNAGTDPEDKMDLENNKVGFAVADSGKDCKKGCAEALANRKLWTIIGGKAVPIPPPPPPSSAPIPTVPGPK